MSDLETGLAILRDVIRGYALRDGGATFSSRYLQAVYDAASVSPSRDSVALLDEYSMASRAYAWWGGLGGSDREGAARAALDRHLASLERDAARMREAATLVIDCYDSGGGADEWALDRTLVSLAAPTTTPETSDGE